MILKLKPSQLQARRQKTWLEKKFADHLLCSLLCLVTLVYDKYQARLNRAACSASMKSYLIWKTIKYLMSLLSICCWYMLTHFQSGNSTPGIYQQQHHNFGCDEIAEGFNITWRYLSIHMYLFVSCCSLLITLLSGVFLSLQRGTCGAEWSWPKELLHMYLNRFFHKPGWEAHPMIWSADHAEWLCLLLVIKLFPQQYFMRICNWRGVISLSVEEENLLSLFNSSLLLVSPFLLSLTSTRFN